MTDLDTCGCCDDRVPEPELYNPPGQAALAYRISLYSQFLERMLARIGRIELPDGDYQGTRPLAGLTTREEDDFSIGLLDGWAVLGDVLTFYQERIANEGFLRTATERFSVLQLARAIGYELGAGVSAETYLAFTLDSSDSTPDTALIPAGTQVQSLPQKQGELPQTFETTDDFDARVAWNRFLPQLSEPQTIAFGTTELWIEGVANNLEAGDVLLFVGQDRHDNPGSERWDVRIITDLSIDDERGLTHLTWSPGLGHTDPHIEPPDDPELYVFRQRAALFGHNAPDFRTMPDEVQNSFNGTGSENDTQWDDFNIASFGGQTVYLDRIYDSIVKDDWIALSGHTGSNAVYTELYRVEEVEKDSRTDFALTAQCSRLDLDTDENLSRFGLRETVVYCEPEPLTIARRPRFDELTAGEKVIELEEEVPGLLSGQQVALRGLSPSGEKVAEIITLAEDAGSTLTLAAGLQHTYVRASAEFNANVIRANHGETVADEVLGSGDGAIPHQQFMLRKPPLTHVAAETPSGNRAELTVRVSGVAWKEVDSLYGLESSAKVFAVRLDNEANARLIFGDGKHGARLPTGQENVRATYRSGIGLAGEVATDTLKLLKTRPFGVRQVTNPVPADGAEDPESLDNARSNAPLTVKTLDRIVSLQDYADFARSFAGIGKAAAVAVWNGREALVHVTVADPTGNVVPADQVEKLRKAMEAARDPARTLCIAGFEPLTFSLAAAVLVDEAYVRADVEADIKAALQAAFAFAERTFGQTVNAAEIIAIIHDRPGVLAVDLNTLYIDGNAQVLNSILTARTARFDPAATDTGCGAVQPAQLLLINPDGIELQEMTP